MIRCFCTAATLALTVLTGCAPANTPIETAPTATSQAARDPAATETPQASRPALPPPPVIRTQVDSVAALERLKIARGMTLQWISWDYMGPVAVSDNNGVIRISASQSERGGNGKASMLGDIVRISDDEFVFRGRIVIIDTPDAGRECVLSSDTAGDQTFAITQNRKYWRLRNFEWCDGLTDYIDIYF